MAAHGYPARVRAGDEINGIDRAEAGGNIVVFHAGAELQQGKLLTAGGRVLGVTALGETLSEARLKAYEAVQRISFAGSQFRRDIALPREGAGDSE